MEKKKKKILVTGAAGFIGYHLCKRLSSLGEEILGVDNINDYYDIQLKHDRIKQLAGLPGYRFLKMDITSTEETGELFSREQFDIVINLAAQAGVRYSLKNPHVYVNTNVTGFLNILEGCRYNKVKHLVFASTSSVYGANTTMPFSTHQNVDHPMSLYAATKKANELMAHTYASLYNLPCTGLRFFTVYGPWGRPDMALFLFTKAIFNNDPIEIYNFGNMKRDFTYVEDIVEGIVRIKDHLPGPDPSWNGGTPDPASSYAPYSIYNIGNNNPVELNRFIQVLEDCIGKKAEKNLLPIQPGDVPATYADVSSLMEAVDFKPSTSIEDGIRQFVDWYKDYYRE